MKPSGRSNYALAMRIYPLHGDYSEPAWLGGGAEAKEAYAKARDEAQVALSLAPISPLHEALGFVL